MQARLVVGSWLCSSPQLCLGVFRRKARVIAGMALASPAWVRHTSTHPSARRCTAAPPGSQTRCSQHPRSTAQRQKDREGRRDRGGRRGEEQQGGTARRQAGQHRMLLPSSHPMPGIVRTAASSRLSSAHGQCSSQRTAQPPITSHCSHLGDSGLGGIVGHLAAHSHVVQAAGHSHVHLRME